MPTRPSKHLTRREFVLSSATGLVLAPHLLAQGGALTAQQVVDRIRTNAGTAPPANTVDGIKAGDPATIVTGIATAVMVTIDALRRAAAARQNFIVVHEPTFYGPNDNPGARATDPVFLAKKKLIDDERLVIYRLHDQWNARTPSEAVKALASELGLNPVLSVGDVYGVSNTTLGDLASQVRAKLGARGGLRVVGPLSLAVRRVLVSPGTTTVPITLAGLQEADAVIAGEPREWEAVPYTYDTEAAGQPKGMIVLGRVLSEGPSMRACAAWLKSLVPEVPVEALPTVDPYWSAGA